MKQVLFISRNLACPDFHGGCVYPYRILEAFAEAGMKIHYLWWSDSLPARPFRLPFRPPFAETLSVVGAFAAGPFFLRNPFQSGEIRECIEKLLQKDATEVILDFAWDAEMLSGLPASTWVLTHELVHRRAESYKEAGIAPDFNVLHESREIELLRNADGLIAIQDEDAAWMQRCFPEKKVVVLPLPVTRKYLPIRKNPSPSVLFIGGNTAHNRSGLEWLVKEVWPLVIDEIPDARLRIYGTVSTSELPLSDAIEVRGPVHEVREAYSENQVAAVPLRFGSGLKIKLLEAMGYGIPAVATPVGAQGFAELAQGSICPVCHDADQFAAALVELLSDSVKRNEIIARQDGWLSRVTDPVRLSERFCQSTAG
jgi:glycosyltransferase involved in cell wall biosynthesis